MDLWENRRVQSRSSKFKVEEECSEMENETWWRWEVEEGRGKRKRRRKDEGIYTLGGGSKGVPGSHFISQDHT